MNRRKMISEMAELVVLAVAGIYGIGMTERKPSRWSRFKEWCATKRRRKLYWVASDGRWDDPMSWAKKPKGKPGAGVPDSETDVFILAPEAGKCIVMTGGVGRSSCHNVAIGGEGIVEWNVDVFAQRLILA